MNYNENLNNENINAKRKKGRFIKPVVLLIVLVILIIILKVFLKSDSQKFIELLTKDQYVVEMLKNRKNEYLKDGEREYNLTLKKGIVSLFGIPSSIIGQDVVLSGNVIIDGKNSDSKFALNMGDTELQSIEVVKEDDIVALSIPNLFDNFIGIKKGNENEIARKMGYFSGDNKDINLLDDVKDVTKKYLMVMSKSINDYIEIIDDVEINIDEITFKTKQYKLNLGTQELNKVYLDILKKLKDDDETLGLITEYYVETDYYKSLVIEDKSKEELKEELKKEITDLYEKKLNEEFDEDEIKEEVLTIYAYDYKGKNIKTTIDYNDKKTSYEIDIMAMNERDTDKIYLALQDSLGTKIELRYLGKVENDNYNGEVSIGSNNALLSLVGLSIKENKNSEVNVRKLSELNMLLLNEATDNQIEDLKNQIGNNLNGENDIEDNNDENNNVIVKEDKTPYEEGEFILVDPTSPVKVLENSIAAYNKLTPGITKDDAIGILGEPNESYTVGSTEYVYWYQNENIYLVSIGVRKGIVYDIYNDVVSSMSKNVQVSEELGTEINDLKTAMENIKLGMTKEETINVLGDKYIETSKDKLGYSTIKWYDKKENSVKIEFDSKNKIWYINEVVADK